MELTIKWNNKIRKAFPHLRISTIILTDVTISKSPENINKIEHQYFTQIKKKFSLMNLKDDIRIRAYREFYWAINIDPTKTRPASEALVRRILAEKPLWRINTFVDSYNIASAITRVTLGAYDLNTIQEEFKNVFLNIRMSEAGETFRGIGMKESKVLKGKELVVESNSKIISIYPYRDAHFARIQNHTKRILLLAYGVPRISLNNLKESLELTVKIYRNFDNAFRTSNIQTFFP